MKLFFDLSCAKGEHGSISQTLMVSIPLPCVGNFGGRTLRLPVEERIGDRVVFIHRGRGVVAFRFIQRYEERIRLYLGEMHHALPDTAAMRRRFISQSRENSSRV